MAVAVLIPAIASATPYYTGADEVSFAKLVPLTGTYRCTDTGGDPPYTARVKVEGAWLVWRENGSDPATEYIRWDAKRKVYLVIETGNDGEYNVSTTTGPDPLNAAWKHEYPPSTMYSTFSTRFAHGEFSLVAKFMVKGKMLTGRLDCKKQ